MTCSTAMAPCGEVAKGGQDVPAIDAGTGLLDGELPVPGLPVEDLPGECGRRVP